MKLFKYKYITVLLPFFLLFTSCEGDKGEVGPEGPQGEEGLNGNDGNPGDDGRDGNTTSFYFQEGFKGYEGTIDMTIFNNPDIIEVHPLLPLPTPDGKNVYVYEAQNPDDASISDKMSVLFRFENLVQEIEKENGDFCSGDYFVNEAILYLSGVSDVPEEMFFQLIIYGKDSPIFDQTSATWDMANEVDSWEIPGGGEDTPYNDPFYGSPEGGGYNGYIFSNTITYGPKYHQPYLLPRAAIEQWICEGINKGFLLQPLDDMNGIEVIYSSEHPDQQLRPLLYINIDKNDGNSREKQLSAEEELLLWNQKSEEEKMAPLYSLYPDLKP